MNPNFPLTHLLPADAAHPEHADAATFGQFVGTWDMDMAFFDRAGRSIYHHKGVWSFAWVLDGRAIQDVLTYANRTAPHSLAPYQRNIGTSLRWYDPHAAQWVVLWLGANSGNLVWLRGGRVGDEIHLFGDEPDGTVNQWMFTDITPEAFHWIGRLSDDGGQSWWVEQEMKAVHRVTGR